MQKKLDFTIVIPAWNEGDAPLKTMKTLLETLESINRPYEILYIDNSTEGNSEEMVSKLNKRNPAFKYVQIPHPGTPVTDKSNKYTIGNLMAKGKYIIYMDSEGKDRPEELPKYLAKLDEGYDLVMGWKQKRSDKFVYKTTSKMTNWLMRTLTGVKVHDMNNGFKGMRAGAVRSINLRGGNFRFTPVLFTAKKYKVTEVKVKHGYNPKGRKEGRFTFKSRLFGGLFDLPITILVSKMGDTPIYFWGGIAIIFMFISVLSTISFVLLYIHIHNDGLYPYAEPATLIALVFSPISFVISVISLFFGISTEYNRANEKRKLSDFEIDKVIE